MIERTPVHFLSCFRRYLYIAFGLLVCIYGLSVLYYVQTIPDLGLKTVFSRAIKARPPFEQFNTNEQPQVGDEVVKVGDLPIETWSDLLNAPVSIQQQFEDDTTMPAWAKMVRVADESVPLIEVRFQRGEHTFSYWCPLRTLPLEFLIPSILWFILKLMLFLVGALVFWKRPTDSAAAQFFLLCVVTLGAYMGGYHWNHISTQPALILVFMICAVMLPAVSLHFFLVFPRRKHFLQTHRQATLATIYGVPLAALVGLIVLYLRVRGLVHGNGLRVEIIDAYDDLKQIIYVLLGQAALWYLASVVSLVYSFRTSTDLLERNQVKWIMFGAVLALIPIGYSLYLTIFDPDAFGAGAATWPMFAASACLTGAFAISITRYRLMELDKIISSGFGYFLISFLAGLLYYGVVFLGTLIFNQVLASPRLSEALTVSTTALILMLLLDMARSRFKKALDRRFSRDKSQLDHTLQQLGQAVEQLVDPQALGQKLLHTTTQLLAVERGSFFLRQGEPPLFQLVEALGEEPSLTELSSGCPLIETLNKGNIVNIRQRMGQLGPDLRQLQLLGGQIALPLVQDNKLLALLVLGPKPTPYGPDDFHLLSAFAQITVLALQNADGHRTIEDLNSELQEKVDKISEQQRRILALQTQLRRQAQPDVSVPKAVSKLGMGENEPEKRPGGMVGNSPAVTNLLSLVKKVSATDAAVLIRGESGTGKELLACAVHETSTRANKPFVKVHCAALSSSLLESELFGHVKGAFTGAHRDKVGRFELANGGTLFLDEIGDISLEVQTKLLRVLQEKTFERVGSSDPVPVDVRIVTATHQDLESLIRQGKFREDLYYRLNVFPILVPPLRNRIEDLPELATFFMRQSAQRCHKDLAQIDDDVLAVLKGYHWPGNIRQLENVMERAVVIAEGPSLTLHDLPVEIATAVPYLETELPQLRNGGTQPTGSSSNGNGQHGMGHHNGTDHEATGQHHGKANGLPARALASHSHASGRRQQSREERDRIEREQLVRILAAADGNKAEAARAMGVARSTLVSRLKKLGLT